MECYVTVEDLIKEYHMNRNRQDNRPENLMIFSSSRDHRLYHHYFKNMEVLRNAQ